MKLEKVLFEALVGSKNRETKNGRTKFKIYKDPTQEDFLNLYKEMKERESKRSDYELRIIAGLKTGVLYVFDASLLHQEAMNILEIDGYSLTNKSKEYYFGTSLLTFKNTGVDPVNFSIHLWGMTKAELPTRWDTKSKEKLLRFVKI